MTEGAWDLALGAGGDLIFSASNDVQGISGTDLVEQRMKMRLALHRGSWVYDEDETFGSQLYSLMGHTPQRAAAQADAYVREALRDMSDIAIDQITIEKQTRSLLMRIYYHVTDEITEPSGDPARQLQVDLPGAFVDE